MTDSAKPRATDEVLARAWKPGERPALDALLEREWLVTNGLGGYASGTVSGAATRRYHGLLIAAHPAPLGRVMMVNHLWEFLRLQKKYWLAPIVLVLALLGLLLVFAQTSAVGPFIYTLF